MAAQPAGYEAFHSLRRKGVTLLCFLLASTMAIGITVYVDSYSVHEWKKNIDVGDIAITVEGPGVETYVDEIQEISGVTGAASLLRGYGSVFKADNETMYLDERGELLAPDNDFLTTFPDYIQMTLGRVPLTASEIAVINSFHTYNNIELGDAIDLNVAGTYYNVTVVGFYSHEGEADSPYSWTHYSIALVVPNLIDAYEERIDVLVNVNRAPLTPFNPTGSLQYLNRIDEAIRRLDPNYTPGYNWPQFHVQNRLASGISQYIYWVQILRITQMLRASSVLFLLVLVIFLAIRHNVNERRYEENMLVSRGAAKGDLEKVTTREVFILSIFSCFIGIPLGLLLSRVAIMSTGFFSFNPSLLFTEPILISLESLIISGIVTVALPMLTLGGYRVVYSTKKNVDADKGKLSKLSRGLGLIRWDVLIVGISGLLLMALSSGPTSNSILSFILPFIPIPLFLGISSLSMKILRGGANGLSRGMRRIVGDIPASI